MLGLPIAVEVLATDRAREHLSVLLSACTRAAGDAECLSAHELDGQDSRAVAIVTWEGRRVLIEIGLRQGERPVRRTRTLQFEPSDDLRERWRTVGLVVGTLARPETAVAEQEGETSMPLEPSGAAPDTNSRDTERIEQPSSDRTRRPDELARRGDSGRPTATDRDRFADRRRQNMKSPKDGSEVTPEGPDPIDVEPARSSSPVSAPRATLDLGGVLGPGLGGTRSGAVVRGRFLGSEPWAVVFSGRYLERPHGDASFGGRWASGAAGIGAIFGTDDLQLTTSIDARAEYLQVVARVDGQEESQGRWLAGLGGSVNGGWMASSALGIFLGIDGAWRFGTTQISVKDQSVATDESIQFGAEAGVRVRLW